MIMDERLEFADATSVGTPDNEVLNVGDDIDLGSAKDVGQGQPVYLVIQVVAAITSGGASNINFLLSSDAASALQVDGTQSIHLRTDTYVVADLIAGWTQVYALPMGDGVLATTTGYEQFLGFQIQETANVALTGGTVNAFLTLDPTGWKSYPDAVN